MSSNSKITSEVRVLDAAQPEGAFTVVEPRRQGVEYSLDHQGDRFVILHNDGALDFELAEAPVATPGREHWRPVIAHSPGTRLIDVDAFADHLVVHLRRDALTAHPDRPRRRRIRGRSSFPSRCSRSSPRENPEFTTAEFRLTYESLVTPPTVYDYEIADRSLVLRKQQPVLGGYDPADYESHRTWAVADDGTRVPISLVHRKGVPKDGSAPCVLYGYGSYEVSMDPWFSVLRLPLLDRGFVFAVAHVRGGGECGRSWYEDGKLLHKRNTFTDFVACAAPHLRPAVHVGRTPGGARWIGRWLAHGRDREHRTRTVQRRSSPKCRSSTRSTRSSTRRCRSRSWSGRSGGTRSSRPTCSST